jgi:hypothetical protein
MRLLITRPEPDNERTATTLRALSHEVMLAPLLRIEAIGDADLGAPPWAAILLTSANGARAIAGHPRRGELMELPVLAVGESTAIAARAAGFGDVTSADGAARDLVRLAVARFAASLLPLLYLAGEDRTADLAGELRRKVNPCAPSLFIAQPRRPIFPPPRGSRWNKGSSTACCISPGEAWRITSIAAVPSSNKRWRRCIIACPGGPPSRSSKQAPRAFW